MPFAPVIMYLNGKEVPSDSIQQTFDAVLEPLKLEHAQELELNIDVA